MDEPRLDETHDPALRSWVESANAADTDFPIQNLPLGVFRRAAGERPRIGVAIGDELLDLAECAGRALVPSESAAAVAAESLNSWMSLTAPARTALRRAVSHLLRADAARRPEGLLLPRADMQLLLPAEIGDYTDFYASVHHATRVGAQLRPEQPLLPNYKWVPIGYHGRASSIVPSGTEIRRPSGQTRPDGAESPVFGPSRRLDYEVEIGFFVGPGNVLGDPVPLGDAEQHLAGVCLLNDWSARDIQKWEYQPLGPFLAKSFATTISPWVVTLDALAPFRAAPRARAPEDPAPLEYLRDDGNLRHGGFDIRVEALLRTHTMRERGEGPFRISAASFLDMYWTPGQMLAHHTSNGCNLRPGDLIASGTVSGPALESAGCLLERTGGGKTALELPGGESRRFIEDGDEVVMRARCERPGYVTIGFGECRSAIVPGS
jgi:fumarylacetoacetase